MTAPIIVPRLETATLTKLRQRYEETPNVESRTRSQMLLLAQQEYKVSQIAGIVLRSEDTVARVLNRFLAGGLDAVPRRTPPGRARRVTAAWEAEFWSLKGRRGQRLIEAPGDNRKGYGFGLVDWRDDWFDGRIATGRTADV